MPQFRCEECKKPHQSVIYETRIGGKEQSFKLEANVMEGLIRLYMQERQRQHHPVIQMLRKWLWEGRME